MKHYNADANQSVDHLEQALKNILDVARAHEPEEAVTPKRPEDVPYEWDEITGVLQAVEHRQPLWADLMRSAVVLRQTQVAYAIAATDKETRPASPRPVEA